MKKLMMFAAAMTIVGGAFAAVDVYDYKASVKNPDLKLVKVYDDETDGYIKVPVKYIKSTSLYGYLVYDACRSCDLPENHGYLVLANKADKYKNVSILPADLLAKIWPANGYDNSKSWLAEGYLFAGCGKDDHAWSTWTPDWFASCDYADATEYLFGDNNYDETGVFFANSWLDAAGFGKATYISGSAQTPCDLPGVSCQALDSLSGSVIGGLYLCAPSAFQQALCLDWGLTTDVISGTWSIKRTNKVAAVAPEANYLNTVNDAEMDSYINGAIKKINKASTFDSVVPSVEDAPNFDRYVVEIPETI